MDGEFEMNDCRISFRHFVVSILLFAFLLSGALAVDASPKDDAYHYMKNGVDDQIYNEWWYFNGIDNDTQFMILYLVSDPENLTGSRKLQSWAVVLEDGKSPVIGVRQSRGFGGDFNSPTFDLDQSGFSPSDSSGIMIHGSIPKKGTADAPSSIKWDLDYQPSLAPWFGIPVQSHIGHLKGDWMKWLVYMPSANVSGSIVVDNQTLNIDGVGYHDHCWGRWALNDPTSVWLETSNPVEGFSISLAEIAGEQKNTFMGLKYNDKTVAFSSKQVKLNVTDFAFDPGTGVVYPAKYEVVAENGEYRLDLMAKVKKSVPIRLDYQPPAPSLVVFGQVADLQGVLKEKNGGEYQFDAAGFTGYSSPLLHPIYGKVGSEKDDLAQVNLSQSNSTQSNLTKTNSTKTNSTQTNSTQTNSTQTNSTQSNSTQSNSTPSRIDSTQFKLAESADIGAITVMAENQRTGQKKTAKATSEGWFSLDADYVDFLAESTAPWVANNDRITLSILDGGRTISRSNLTINLSEEKQEVRFAE